MDNTKFRFNRMELAGSLGDLGVLIPLGIALVVLCKLSFSAVFLMVGLFYIVSGIYFRLPLPVQPLKVVSAVAIASPTIVNASILSASALVFGTVLLVFMLTGLIDRIAGFFSKSIVCGIQLGLGLILIKKGLGFMMTTDLFGLTNKLTHSFQGWSPNLILGLAGALVTLVLITNKKFPAALVLVIAGFTIGLFDGRLSNTELSLGPTSLQIIWPTADNFLVAIMLLVIPQIPLTIGNAIIGTKATAESLFGSGVETSRVTNKSLTLSMALANLIIGFFAAIPLCHGAGGLAAHYRFGARTGGSNIMIGAIFIVIALLFGSIGITLLTSLPNAILGILLVFAGLELGMLIRVLNNKNDLFVAILIAAIGFISTNMSIAFAIGILVQYIIKLFKIKL